MNKYLKLIQDSFPNISYKNVKIITKGWSNDIVILNDNIIFRFPKEDFVKNNFIKEVKFLNILGEEIKGIQIPKYIYISKNNDFGGYKAIEGIELKNIYLKIIFIWKKLQNKYDNF